MQESIVKKGRLLWLDYAKCISIFAIVMLHTFDQILGYSVVAWTSSFALQLFFMISGYFTRDTDSIKETFIKSCKTILVPYFAFHLLILVFYFVTQALLDPNFYSTFLEVLRRAIVGILLGDDRSTSYSINLNSPLWFLLSLFLCKVLLQIVIKNKRFLNLKLGLLTAISVIICYLLRSYNIAIDFGIDSAIMAMPFYVLGYLLRKVDLEKINNIKKSYTLLAGIILLFVSVVLSNYNQSDYNRVDMNNCAYGNSLILFYLDALIGAFSILFISKFLSIKEFKLLSYWGQNTLIILGVHFTFVKYLKKFEGYILSDIFGLKSFNPVVMYIDNFIICILVMFMCIPVIYIIRKYFPFMIGDFRTKKMTPVA